MVRAQQHYPMRTQEAPKTKLPIWRRAHLGELPQALGDLRMLRGKNPENIKITVIAMMMSYSMEKNSRPD